MTKCINIKNKIVCYIKSKSELSKRFLLKITKSEAPQAKAKSPQQQDPSYCKSKRERGGGEANTAAMF